MNFIELLADGQRHVVQVDCVESVVPCGDKCKVVVVGGKNATLVLVDEPYEAFRSRLNMVLGFDWPQDEGGFGFKWDGKRWEKDD